MSPTQIHPDTMKVDGVSGGDLELVHHPEAAVIDRAHVDFEFTGQLHGIDLLVVVRADGQGIRRVDVSPLGPADADEGAHAVERGTAGVVGLESASRTYFQFHFVFSFLRLAYC